MTDLTEATVATVATVLIAAGSGDGPVVPVDPVARRGLIVPVGASNDLVSNAVPVKAEIGVGPPLSDARRWRRDPRPSGCGRCGPIATS